MTRAGTAVFALALALIGVWLSALASCRSCAHEPFIAELVATERRVERDFGRKPNSWSAAKQGDRFHMGDALRTGPKAEATMSLAQQGRLLVKSDTVVRFLHHLDGGLDQAQPQPQFDVLQGELTVESGAQPIAVHTTGGVVRIDQASTVRVHADPDVSRFDVEVGRVEYTVNGVPQVAEAGGSFELQVLEVSVESADARAHAATTKAAAPDAGGAASAASTADARDEPRAAAPDPDPVLESPATALVTFTAGESVTIHDPAPPSDVAVVAERCAQQIALEVHGGPRSRSPLRYRGTGEVRARLPRGNYRYRVRCLPQAGHAASPVVASGHLKVVQDAATRPLPLAPVSITADADGRRYTVSYQNRPPIITLRWPYAPRAKRYHLVVQQADGQPFSVDADEATVTLPPGRLREGSHKFWFETADHTRSETGTLQVSFDYTARTAYLTSPREGATLRENTARFAGGTLLGSHVQVQGATLRLDAHGRFATTVSVAPELAGASVRVQHPSTGLHYYIRHLTR